MLYIGLICLKSSLVLFIFKVLIAVKDIAKFHSDFYNPNEICRLDDSSNCGHVLIIQLNRFSKFYGDTFKDTRFVECLPVKDHILTVPLKLDDVSFSKEFSLVATINYSGSLNAGHYWAFIKDNISISWFKCDDMWRRV